MGTDELKPIGTGSSGLPQGRGGRRQAPSPPPKAEPEPREDATDLALEAARRARGLSDDLEALQRRVLDLPEGAPAREEAVRRLAEIQVTLSNLLSLPSPSATPSPERVLELLKGRT